jgi:hypothetical protein
MQRSHPRDFARSLVRLVVAGALAAPLAVTAARAEDAPKTTPAAPAASAAVWEKLGLPHYSPPASYSEDLVITSDGQTFTIRRAVDGAKVRTEMASGGQDMVMIELGDERGTMYNLMPDRKEATKMSRASMDEMSGGRMGRAEAGKAKEAGAEPAAPPDVKVEDLGDDPVAGVPARKLRLTSSDGVVLAWFEKATGAPLRMENTTDGKVAAIEWRNRKPEAQPAARFEVPKDYKLDDMDEMMAKMKSMGGMRGMASGMMGGVMQGMGSNMGASFGAGIGGSLGGPLGAMAGQYIGGRVGAMIGKKAADVAR